MIPCPKNTTPHFWIWSALFLYSLPANSQAIQSEPHPAHQVLPSVDVYSTVLTPERMKAVEEQSIFVAKKNEVIRLDNIHANTAINNAREVFSRIPGVTIWEGEGLGIQTSISTRGLSPNRSWELNTRQNGYDISADIFGYPGPGLLPAEPRTFYLTLNLKL